MNQEVKVNKLKTALGTVISTVALMGLAPAAIAHPTQGGDGQMGPGMMHNQQGRPGMMHRPGGGMMGPGGMHGPGGGMMGPGMMNGMSPMMMQQLNLSREQHEKMAEMMHKQRKENFKKMEKMMDLRYEMQKAMNKPEPDPKEVGKVAEKMFQIKRGMMENRIETQNKMRGMLNEQQRERFDAMRHGGMGGM